MAENVVGYAITAKLDQFRAELAKIPDIGASEAKSLTAALSKEIKNAEKASRDAAKASKDAASGFKQAASAADGMRSGLSKAGEGLSKVAAGLSVIDPGLGAAVANLQKFEGVATAAAGSGEILGSAVADIALGPVGLAAGVAAAAFLAYQHATDQAAEATRQQAEADRDAVAAMKGLDDQLFAATLHAKVLSGDITAAQEASLKAGHSVAEEFSPALAEAATNLAKARKEAADYHAKVGTPIGLGSTYAANHIEELNKAADDQQQTFDDLRNKYLELQRVTESNASADQGAKDAKAGATAASKAATAATKTEKDAIQDLVQEAERLNAVEAARVSTYESNLSALDRAHDAALRAATDAQDQIHLDAQAAREAAAGAASEAQAAANSSDERKRIARELAETLAAINQQEVVDTKKAEDAKARVAAETAAKVRSAYSSAASDLADSISSVADTVESAAERQGESAKKAALTAFRVSQGAAIASTVVTTAEAAMRAYADALALGPAGLALAPIAAGAAAAVGAAQVASIAAEAPPKFHSGLAPDEVPATLTRGEGVLSPRGVRAIGGSDSVRNLNRGEPAGDRPIVVVQQFRHRVLDAAIAENLRLPTSPLRRAIRAGKRVGHRRRDNS